VQQEFQLKLTLDVKTMKNNYKANIMHYRILHLTIIYPSYHS